MRTRTTRIRRSTTALALAAGALTAATAPASPINTDPAGSVAPQPFSNMQPSLALHFAFPLQGTFGNGQPLRMFAFSDTTMAQLNASGWLSPNGQVLSVQQNTALFSQISNNYGGNGMSTFAVPDLRGRTPIGEGHHLGLSTYTRGQVVGQSATTITLGQLPAHTHNHDKAVVGATGPAGGGQPVTNIQPSLAINYSITATGDLPPHNGNAVISSPNVPFRGQMMLHTATPSGAYANSFLPADGDLVPLVLNTALYALLGASYGGNGQSNFGLPDLRGTATVDAGDGPSLEVRVLGEVFGSELCAFNMLNLPPHAHTVPGPPALAPTGSTGGGQPFSNAQPSLAMNYCIALSGAFPGQSPMSDQVGYLGEIILLASNYTPTGYAACSGQLLPISQNQALFSLIGTTFGGNGVQTFALPDLRGRVPVGASLGANGIPAGTKLGTDSVTLTMANIPAHTHTLQPYCPADIGKAGGLIGHDGLRDNNDFIAFITLFFLSDPSADMGIAGGFDGSDGLFDNNDFIAFINAFFADCPW